MRHTCTGSQSIAEGKLLDVSDQAHTFGFRVPGAISKAAWSDTVEWDHGGFHPGKLARIQPHTPISQKPSTKAEELH